ncbi:c-type cytochrome [Ferrimonas marina]|uniref:Cytochrome c553 n=1 Tax=Ferrimonas marina TaxID=299255 RepID=A0A1M5XPW5_9GAMM|nr:c-type cytochrome [Ferrimonas marina]SHI01806.1 Cytochrome c553 [Ferrimonas marina]
MKKFVVALAVLSSISTTAMAQGDASAGQAKAATCVACHGMDGNSPIDMYPKIAGQHVDYLIKQINEFKLAGQTNGEQGRHDPVMSGMAMMLATEQDVADVSAWYASQSISPGAEVSAEIADQGHALYMGGDPERQITACVACHGVDGQGMSLAGYPAVASQHTGYLKAQLEKFRSGARHNDLNGMMGDIAKKLTDEEIELLAQYINSMK